MPPYYLKYYLSYGWQMLVALVFIAAAIFVGGLLLHRSILKRQPEMRVKQGRCHVAVLLAALAGAIAGYVALKLFGTLGAGLIVSAIPAFLAMLVLAYLVLYAMFNMPAAKILSAMVIPVLAVAGIGVVCGGAIVYGGYTLGQARIQRDKATQSLGTVQLQLEKYQENRQQVDANMLAPWLPETLRVLDLPADLLYYNPEDPNTPRYVYVRPEGNKIDRMNQGLMIAEVRKSGKGRVVLYVSGEVQWLAEDKFQDLLQDKANQTFAEAFRKATGG